MNISLPIHLHRSSEACLLVDACMQGCAASVLLYSANGNETEKDADPNKTPRGFGVIDRVMEDKACPWTVLALVARDVVVLVRATPE